MLFKKNENEYTFVADKKSYTLEKLKGSIEIYETDNPLRTGFVFNGGLKNFILFINTITDIAEDIIGEEDEAEETI